MGEDEQTQSENEQTQSENEQTQSENEQNESENEQNDEENKQADVGENNHPIPQYNAKYAVGDTVRILESHENPYFHNRIGYIRTVCDGSYFGLSYTIKFVFTEQIEQVY